MINQIRRICRFNYVEYDKENRLAISLIVLAGKIGQVRKIIEIRDFDMDEIPIGKTDLSKILGLQ